MRNMLLITAAIMIAALTGCAGIGQYEQEKYVLLGIQKDEVRAAALKVLKEDMKIPLVEEDKEGGTISTGWIRPYFPPDMAFPNQTLGATVLVTIGEQADGCWFWVEVEEDFKLSTRASDRMVDFRRPGFLQQQINPGYVVAQRNNPAIEADITRKMISRLREARGGEPLPKSPEGSIPLPDEKTE
ncbi:MAG TPA: hypothetical protein PL033_11075 [Candidatus Brocadiia bacterium]|nr:hypothetical protein [Candidatus Brocadiia bacterium]